MSDGIKRGEEDRLLHDFVNRGRKSITFSARLAAQERLDMAQRMMMETYKAGVVGRVIDDSEAPTGVIAIATEAILSVGHFINHPKVIAAMDEARPLFASALPPRTRTPCRGLSRAGRVRQALPRGHAPNTVPPPPRGRGPVLRRHEH